MFKNNRKFNAAIMVIKDQKRIQNYIDQVISLLHQVYIKLENYI